MTWKIEIKKGKRMMNMVDRVEIEEGPWILLLIPLALKTKKKNR